MKIKPGMVININESDTAWLVQEVNKGKMTLVDFYMGIVELDEIDIEEVTQVIEDETDDYFDEDEWDDE